MSLTSFQRLWPRAELAADDGVTATQNPSIPSDNAAARMITERAGAGVAVEPGDSAELILAAKRLLADPELRSEMGAAGRRFAEATFSSDQVARQLIGIVNR